MKEFELITYKKHLLFSSGGKTILLDTGAPSSVSDDGRLSFLDKNTTVPRNYLGVTTEKLSEYIGMKIDALLGTDMLLDQSMFISPGSNRILFSESPADKNESTFSFKLFMGIPVIPFSFNGVLHAGFLDTGATLSYLKAGMVGDLPATGEQPDFYPGYGRFTTRTYTSPVQIAGQSFLGTFGTLPFILEQTLIMAGVHGIIGFDFFNSFDVQIDYPNKEITVWQRDT
jgi:hypothetical protein